MQVKVTQIDRKVARFAAKYSNESLKNFLQCVTMAGNEKVLIPGSLLAWITAALRNTKPEKYRHLFTALVIVVALDHLSKHLFDQQRPDRIGKRYRQSGIPRSSGKYNSFPSGHAMLLGAAARALQRAYPEAKILIWGTIGAIASTRILLLAHWLSDVVAGIAAGIAAEEIINLLENAMLERCSLTSLP